MKDYLKRFDHGNPLHIAWFNAVIDRLTKVDPMALRDGSELDDMWRAATETAAPAKPIQVKTEINEWKTAIRALNLSQPDRSTCQSACVGMAVNDKDIYGIREKLLATGLPAGSTTAMGRVIQSYGVNYKFQGNANLHDVFTWLRGGELLITHGYFTRSGHVICLDGLFAKNRGSRYLISVKDPWSEFDAPSWSYSNSSKFFDGYYSELCIYAACVASANRDEAARIYREGYVDRSQRGMWVHRISPTQID